MDIRYLESLISIVELGSIARAAKAQHLTPAAVGQRIASLEEYFGTALLDRSSREAVPTEACARLIPKARLVVREFYEMGSILDPSGLSGRFKIGAISAALTDVLPGAVRHLSKVAPKLVLEIALGSSESLYSDLNERKIDAAVIVLPPFDLPRRCTVAILREEPLLLLSNKSHGATPREKLEQNPLIGFDSRSWGGLTAIQYLKDEKLHIEPFCELDTLQPIQKLVIEGMGVALVPQWPGLNPKRSDLDIDVIGDRRYLRKMALITPQDTTRPKMIEVVHEALKASANPS